MIYLILVSLLCWRRYVVPHIMAWAATSLVLFARELRNEPLQLKPTKYCARPHFTLYLIRKWHLCWLFHCVLWFYPAPPGDFTITKLIIIKIRASGSNQQSLPVPYGMNLIVVSSFVGVDGHHDVGWYLNLTCAKICTPIHHTSSNNKFGGATRKGSL